MIVCRWCKEDVEIPFEETQDAKGRTYLKGLCPSCGKTNKSWPKKET